MKGTFRSLSSTEKLVNSKGLFSFDIITVYFAKNGSEKLVVTFKVERTLDKKKMV
jgi:hypothetical protein